MVKQNELLGISPKQRDRVAILISHRQFAHLFRFQAGIAGWTVLKFLGDGKLVHLRSAIYDIHFRNGAGVRVVDVVGIGCVACRGAEHPVDGGIRAQVLRPDAEGMNGSRGAIGIDQWLVEAQSLRRWVTEKPFSPGECPEIRIERAVLLVQEKRLFDVLLKQSEFLSVSETRLALQGTRVAGDCSA